MSIAYSRDLNPMGAAGAAKLAKNHLNEASGLIAMIGDSFLKTGPTPVDSISPRTADQMIDRAHG
jgi:hypothetical protein